MSKVVKIFIDDMTQNTNFEDEKKGKFWNLNMTMASQDEDMN